jgi:serine/threonine protein kinase
MSTFTSEPGTRLGGRYRLEDRVAAASGWAAWKAIDETLARAVTVVTLAPGYPRILEVVTAARAASRLTDSRLAQVFDVEDNWDNAYIVVEWATGETVDDLLSAGPIEPSRGARIVAEAAAALSVAHAAGLAHLCLTPGSLRWTPGGGVKVVGLGIDAALAGLHAEDPALADTRGLGSVLYAALTGHWPGQDYPALPPAPLADGRPRSPRQVRAGVPTSLDAITCRALQLRGRDGDPMLTTPGQLAAALTAVIPPAPLPPVSPPVRAEGPRQPYRQDRGDGYYQDRQDRQDRGDGYWPDRQAPPAGVRPGRPSRPGRAKPNRGAGSKVRVGVIVTLILVAVAGIVAATSHLWSRHGTAPPSGTSRSHPAHQPGSPTAAALTPVSAKGFDAYSNSRSDPGDENSDTAGAAIDGSMRTAWSTDWYKGSPRFGNVKPGTGLILNMGKPVRLSSVTVKFGPGGGTGADAQIEVGSSDTRAPGTLSQFTTVASGSGLSGPHTFTTDSKASGRYVLIWFTSLPPMAGVPASQDRFQAEIFNIVVRGTAVQASG